MIKQQREQQRAKFALIRWHYYEEHIQELQYYAKVSAISFFKSLKHLTKEEVNLLAERYYKSSEGANYNEDLGCFKTVIPVPYKIVAEGFKRPQNDIQDTLKQIERKLGALMLQYETEIEKTDAEKSLAQLEAVVMDGLEDFREREIIAKAFKQVALQRIEKNGTGRL